MKQDQTRRHKPKERFPRRPKSQQEGKENDGNIYSIASFIYRNDSQLMVHDGHVCNGRLKGRCCRPSKHCYYPSGLFRYFGKGVLVGSGVNIVNNVSIGDFSRIGAGAVVIRNVNENATAVGVPAKEIQKP